MLAASGPGAATRFERARRAASELRGSLPAVPMGLASLTDRLLPHLFPTTNAPAFAATLTRAIGVEQPPPRDQSRRATSFAALADATVWSFFSDDVENRVLVVFTDGEGQRDDPVRLAQDLAGRTRIPILFVHVWDEDERVYSGGVAEAQYAADPASRGLLERLARVTRGDVFEEEDGRGLRAAVQRRLGTSRGKTERIASRPRALAPFAVAGAFAPLALVLWRRNRA